MSLTRTLVTVRDVNEHGFDIKDNTSVPSYHRHPTGRLDETSLAMHGPDVILMGPLNLVTIYNGVAEIREKVGIAGLQKRRVEAQLRTRPPAR